MVEVKLLVVKIKDVRNKTFTFTLTGAAAVTSFLLYHGIKPCPSLVKQGW